MGLANLVEVQFLIFYTLLLTFTSASAIILLLVVLIVDSHFIYFSVLIFPLSVLLLLGVALERLRYWMGFAAAHFNIIIDRPLIKSMLHPFLLFPFFPILFLFYFILVFLVNISICRRMYINNIQMIKSPQIDYKTYSQQMRAALSGP